MSLAPDHLQCIPLFRGFNLEQLGQLGGLFQKMQVEEGTTLFEVGDPAQAFYVLTQGEVTVYEGDQVRCQLWPPAAIGELGALAGLRRVTRAVVSRPSEIWQVGRDTLWDLFHAQVSIALPFYQNLVAIIADKVRRDQIRMEDMRRNIVRTQKAMKQMRDYVFEAPDTPISETLHDRLEELIGNNRRINYRVEPPAAHSAGLRMDDGRLVAVAEISRTHLSYYLRHGTPPAEGARLSSVLCLGGPEIPISGTVLRVVKGRVDVQLDLLLEEYGSVLDGYLTRLQMLDFMV